MLNNISIMGRITKDLELKETQSGKKVLSFDIATDRDVKDVNGDRISDFFHCTAWNNNAQFIKNYFCKGSLIVLTGRIQNNNYKAQDGSFRERTEILIASANFSGEKKKQEEIDYDAEIRDIPSMPEAEAIDPNAVGLPFELM